jgi:hypothetical protein
VIFPIREIVRSKVRDLAKCRSGDYVAISAHGPPDVGVTHKLPLDGKSHSHAVQQRAIFVASESISGVRMAKTQKEEAAPPLPFIRLTAALGSERLRFLPRAVCVLLPRFRVFSGALCVCRSVVY